MTLRYKSADAFIRAADTGEHRAGENGTFIFPLSSETAVKRHLWDYGSVDEILDHSEAAVDLDWLNGGSAPLLDGHNLHSGMRAQIGVVIRAWVENKRVWVEVRFSNQDHAQAIKQDVEQDIVRNVSIGYEILKYELDEEKDELRITRWRPYEASFVPLPADESVGVGRSAITSTTEGIMPQENTLPGVPTEEQRAEAMTQAVNDINALATEHNCSDLARSHITGALTRGETPNVALFRGLVAAQLPEGTPLQNTDIGLTTNERNQFSFVHLMRKMLDPSYELGNFEMEAVAAARKAQGDNQSKHNGHVLPTDLMARWNDFELNGVRSSEYFSRAALATSGNPNILTTDHMSASFIDNLRNSSAVLGAGATMMSGLSSDLEIPGGDANIQAQWLASEDADVAESNPTFRKVELAPKDLGAFTDVTRRMLQQQTISLEAYIRDQMVQAMRLAIDSAALYGSGASGIPEGLANITGIGSVTFAGAIPTRDEIIDLRTSIAETNRGAGVTHLGNSGMVGDLQKTRVDAGSGVFLMGDSRDRLVGNPFSETNQITDGDIFTGVWSDMIIGMWGGLELDMSSEAKFLSGGKRFRVIGTVDSNVTRVGSFALGNDGV